MLACRRGLHRGFYWTRGARRGLPTTPAKCSSHLPEWTRTALPTHLCPLPCPVQGSWSIGLFRGPSPLNLTPIEHTVPRLDGHTAWPLANPILTCASVTDAPSNFGALSSCCAVMCCACSNDACTNRRNTL